MAKVKDIPPFSQGTRADEVEEPRWYYPHGTVVIRNPSGQHVMVDCDLRVWYVDRKGEHLVRTPDYAPVELVRELASFLNDTVQHTPSGETAGGRADDRSRYGRAHRGPLHQHGGDSHAAVSEREARYEWPPVFGPAAFFMRSWRPV